MTQALLHEPLELRGQSGEWLSIVTAYRYPGWIRVEAVEDARGTLPGPSPVDPLAIARDLVGAPYEWGGLTGHGLDCSGLVHIAYRLTGRLVPRDSWQQEAAGVRVPAGDERRGDVVSYGEGERADHVAFSLGDGRILHATSREGLGVVEEQEPPELWALRRLVFRL